MDEQLLTNEELLATGECRTGNCIETAGPDEHCALHSAQAQLEKAREEAVHWKANHDQQVRFKRVTAEKRDEFQAERDAAIERGVRVYHYAKERRELQADLWEAYEFMECRAEQAEAREKTLREALRKILPYAEAYDPAEYGGEEPTQEVDIAAALAVLEEE